MKRACDRGSYFIINILLAAVITLIFAYSAIFSPEENDYPVKCVHEIATGKPCPSCGLSHSFSDIIRGNLQEAAQWNSNGIAVFLFFLLQLTMRISFAIAISRSGALSTKRLVVFDVTLSVVTFLLAFYNYIVYYPSLIFS